MNIVQLEKPYCVIGRCTTIDPLKQRGAATRGWFQDVAEAEAHAVDLLRRNPHGHSNTTTELFVVQAVRIVRTPLNYEIVVVQP